MLHLSHTRLLAESLCGTTVDLDGEPELPMICDDCLQHATALGADVGQWFDDRDTPQLLLAA